jgi:hypothetical protein
LLACSHEEERCEGGKKKELGLLQQLALLEREKKTNKKGRGLSCCWLLRGEEEREQESGSGRGKKMRWRLELLL